MLGVGGGLYLIGVARRPEICLGLNIFRAIGGEKRVQGGNFGSTNFKRDIARRKRRVLRRSRMARSIGCSSLRFDS